MNSAVILPSPLPSLPLLALPPTSQPARTSPAPAVADSRRRLRRDSPAVDMWSPPGCLLSRLLNEDLYSWDRRASSREVVTEEAVMALNGGEPTDSTVLATLFDGVTLTRPELSDRTGLSRPTIAESVRRLLGTGIVAEAGVRRGQLGRVPTYYGLAPTAGYVV